MGWQRGARAALLLAGAIAFAACGGSNGTTDVPADNGGGGGESSGGGAGGGGGTTSTGGGGGGGSIVTEHDAGTPVIDSGTPDAGQTETDAGIADAGTPDAGTGFQFGTPGPWAVSNVVYGAANGIQESPIVGITTDESQNIWVATRSALYLLKPGQVTFKRFTSANGLHLSDNPVFYDDSHISNAPAGSSHVAGAAVSPGIMEVVGGGPNEVFLGYAGNEDGDGTIVDSGRHSGKIDQVKLNPDGSLTVNRFDLVANQHGMFYWHNRTVYRMIYDHFIHPHTLYAGTNHGVDMLLPDLFVGPPANGGYPDTDSYYLKWMGDHLHARVCYHITCPDNSEEGQRMGEWRGLALDAAGDLWHAGRWTAGAIKWDPSIKNWYMRPGSTAMKKAFGDPYGGPNDTNGNGFANEPVFKVPQEGDAVSLSAVTVAPDGKVWFASEPWYGTGLDATPYGIAYWDGLKFTVIDPVASLGAPEKLVHDLVALPDGRIAIGFTNSGLLFYDPATGDKKWMHGGSGIADDHIMRMSLDTMVSPPALHVATENGASVIRVMP